MSAGRPAWRGALCGRGRRRLAGSSRPHCATNAAGRRREGRALPPPKGTLNLLLHRPKRALGAKSALAGQLQRAPRRARRAQYGSQGAACAIGYKTGRGAGAESRASQGSQSRGASRSRTHVQLGGNAIEEVVAICQRKGTGAVALTCARNLLKGCAGLRRGHNEVLPKPVQRRSGRKKDQRGGVGDVKGSGEGYDRGLRH